MEVGSRVDFLGSRHRARTEKGVGWGKHEWRGMQSKNLPQNRLNCKLQLKHLETLTTQKNSASFLGNLFNEEFMVSVVSVILSLLQDSISRKCWT